MKTALLKAELLEKANEELVKFNGYREGMKINEARMEGNVLLLGITGAGDTWHEVSEFMQEFCSRYTLA